MKIKEERLKIKVSTAPEQTMAVAADFAKTLKGGEFISLIGDLGAGKTTFTRGLVESLGGTVRVKSPTFTVMNEYPVNSGNIKRVVHIDFYRFTDAAELGALSLEDERRPDTVIIAEWPDALKDIQWQESVRVTIEHGETDGERTICLQILQN
jgi:tRNA threonylcarbamoyladenosine biosynthesis protein TsaE